VEINTEAAGSDITEYTPTNAKPSAGMFGFLYHHHHQQQTYIGDIQIDSISKRKKTIQDVQ